MLLAVTAFGVWLGWYVNRAERQRKAVEWAEQNGGHVIYAFQLHENLRHQNVAHWPGPTWIGIDYLSPVWGISFSRGGLKEIGQLKDLPSLRILGLYDGPSDLQVLSKLRQLQILTISGCPICDISPVAHLRKLTKLTIEGAPVEDIAAISSLTSLESISFYNTSVRDLSPLSTLKKLKRVNFSNSRIGDLAPIANL